MHWIRDYQLFLFDFDGLLVNTEEIHHQAYVRMCAGRGYDLDWSFQRYCMAAHYSAEGLRDQVYEKFPELYSQEPEWNILYAEKKQAFIDLIQEGAVHLMPGVESFLSALANIDVKRCVVTHSASQLVTIIRKKNPILDTIPFWMTREDYSTPKPSPECYLKAIAKYARDMDKIIGFEDSPRGFNALRMTRALPILICPPDYPGLDEIKKDGILCYSSFEHLPYWSLKTGSS